MAFNTGRGRIVTDELLICLDAGDVKSYPGSGTTWYDRTKNGYNGTISGASFNSNQGNGALFFDGTDDYVSVPFGNGRNISSDNISYDIWVKSNILSGSRICFINSSKSDSSNKFYFGQSNSSFDMGIKNSDWEATYLATGVPYNAQFVEVAKWTHFCLTVNSTITRCYKNGRNVVSASTDSNGNPTYTSFTKSSSSVVYTQDLEIGGWASGSANFFSGWIGAMRVYNKTLSSAEVLLNYRAHKFRYV